MWTCVNRRMAKKFGDHFIFVNKKGQVAIADHSIRDLNDPSSTDDGLLIWDGGKGEFTVGSRSVLFQFDLIYRGGGKTKASIYITLISAFILAQLVDKDITEIVPGYF